MCCFCCFCSCCCCCCYCLSFLCPLQFYSLTALYYIVTRKIGFYLRPDTILFFQDQSLYSLSNNSGIMLFHLYRYTHTQRARPFFHYRYNKDEMIFLFIFYQSYIHHTIYDMYTRMDCTTVYIHIMHTFFCSTIFFCRLLVWYEYTNISEGDILHTCF